MNLSRTRVIATALILLTIPTLQAAKRAPAQAKKSAKCDFKISCEIFEQKFALNFKSISGKCEDSDMAVTLEKEGAEKSEMKIKDDGYLYTDNVVKTPASVCKNEKMPNAFAAYPLGNDKMILFVKSDGRPGNNHVNAILIDPVKGEALDTKKLGRSKNTYIATLPTKTGFKLRLIRDELSLAKDLSCDCDAAFVDDWMEVTAKGSRLQSKWIKK